MRLIYLFLFIAAILLHACRDKSSYLNKITVLKDYPSGSGIACLKNKIYLIGDDASYVLITDTGFNSIDTIPFFHSPEKRIPKNIKKDPEAAAIISLNKSPFLLVVGSGSLAPHRNFCWLVNLVSQEKIEVSLDTFYNRLRAAGIKELNIEGVAAIPGGIILASRGNKAYPKNYLIFTSNKFWQDQTNATFNLANIGFNKDTAIFNGISGLEYSKLTDQLLLTVSTENTYSSHVDGEIGKSYLWVIRDITTKRSYAGINPNKIIDLEEIDSRFNKQKIESLCILSENNKESDLVFVSDDDKGGSVLFKIKFIKVR